MLRGVQAGVHSAPCSGRALAIATPVPCAWQAEKLLLPLHSLLMHTSSLGPLTPPPSPPACRLLQVSKIRLGVTFSMVVVMLATGAVCSWHFYQLSVVVPLLKARRQRLPLQHTQLAAAAVGHHHHHHAPGLHGVAAAAAAAAQQQQNGVAGAAGASTTTRSPKRRAGVGAAAADG